MRERSEKFEYLRRNHPHPRERKGSTRNPVMSRRHIVTFCKGPSTQASKETSRHLEPCVILALNRGPALPQARVVLRIYGPVALVVVPVEASVVPLRIGSRERDLGLALEKLHAETHGDMECNMAMHQPCTRVVRGVSDDEPTAGREVDNIATRRVGEFELRKMGRDVESTSALAKNIAVVTVEMDGVSDRRSVGSLLDYPICPLYVCGQITSKHSVSLENLRQQKERQKRHCTLAGSCCCSQQHTSG